MSILQYILIQNQNSWAVRIIITLLGILTAIFAFYSYYSYSDISSEELQYLNVNVTSFRTEENGRIDFYFTTKEYKNEFRIWSVLYSSITSTKLDEFTSSGKQFKVGILSKDAEKLDNREAIIDVYEIDNEVLSLNVANQSERDNAKVGLGIGYIFTALVPIYWILTYIQLKRG